MMCTRFVTLIDGQESLFIDRGNVQDGVGLRTGYERLDVAMRSAE